MLLSALRQTHHCSSGEKAEKELIKKKKRIYDPVYPHSPCNMLAKQPKFVIERKGVPMKRGKKT